MSIHTRKSLPVHSSTYSALSNKFGEEIRRKQRQRMFNSERKKHCEEMAEEIYYRDYEGLFYEELRKEIAEEEARKEYE